MSRKNISLIIEGLNEARTRKEVNTAADLKKGDKVREKNWKIVYVVKSVSKKAVKAEPVDDPSLSGGLSKGDMQWYQPEKRKVTLEDGVYVIWGVNEETTDLKETANFKSSSKGTIDFKGKVGVIDWDGKVLDPDKVHTLKPGDSCFYRSNKGKEYYVMNVRGKMVVTKNGSIDNVKPTKEILKSINVSESGHPVRVCIEEGNHPYSPEYVDVDNDEMLGMIHKGNVNTILGQLLDDILVNSYYAEDAKVGLFREVEWLMKKFPEKVRDEYNDGVFSTETIKKKYKEASKLVKKLKKKYKINESAKIQKYIEKSKDFIDLITGSVFTDLFLEDFAKSPKGKKALRGSYSDIRSAMNDYLVSKYPSVMNLKSTKGSIEDVLDWFMDEVDGYRED